VRRRPDISLAKERLGWTPKIPLRQGLATTIEHFRKELGLTSA
jgi:UDP-glucuronate decarboxylase